MNVIKAIKDRESKGLPVPELLQLQLDRCHEVDHWKVDPDNDGHIIVKVFDDVKVIDYRDTPYIPLVYVNDEMVNLHQLRIHLGSRPF